MSGVGNVKPIKDAITARDLNCVFSQLMNFHNGGNKISTMDMCSLIEHVFDQAIGPYQKCAFLGLLFSQNVHKGFSEQETKSIISRSVSAGEVTGEYVRSVL